MHLFVDNVVPYRFESRYQGGVAGGGCYVCHARIEVCGAYCVSYCCALLTRREMLLGIFGGGYVYSFGTVGYTAYVDEAFGHVQIECVACKVVHLYKCEFYLLMAGSLVDRIAVVVGCVASFEEYSVYVACALLCNVEPFAFACCAVICDGAFVHVAHVV